MDGGYEGGPRNRGVSAQVTDGKEKDRGRMSMELETSAMGEMEMARRKGGRCSDGVDFKQTKERRLVYCSTVFSLQDSGTTSLRTEQTSRTEVSGIKESIFAVACARAWQCYFGRCVPAAGSSGQHVRCLCVGWVAVRFRLFGGRAWRIR